MSLEQILKIKVSKTCTEVELTGKTRERQSPSIFPEYFKGVGKITKVNDVRRTEMHSSI